MILWSALGALCVILLLYFALDTWAYRRPGLLLLFGLLTSGFSVLLKATPTMLKSVPGLPWSASELDIAASVVDPTLIGLAGGLIASAFVLKLQLLHAEDLATKRRALDAAREQVEEAKKFDEDLRLVAIRLDDKDFRNRLRTVRRMRARAFLEEQDAKADLERVATPDAK